MPSICRMCYRCNGSSRLRTIVPITDTDTNITYKCTRCDYDETITIAASSLGDTGYISEYVPPSIVWH